MASNSTSRIAKTAAFVYDFLADDGWELLVGLAIFLPLTALLIRAGAHGWSGAALIVACVVTTVSVSLARKIPGKRR